MLDPILSLLSLWEVINTMPRKSEIQKKFIQTALSEIPKYLANYPEQDQTIVQEVLSILTQHPSVDIKQHRERFTEQSRVLLTSYSHDRREIYLQNAFLWFVVSYLGKAIRILDQASFHADEFYQYLLQHIRGTPQVVGMFPLLRKRTPLTDLAWEQLQYACSKLTVPLSREEVSLLFSILDADHKVVKKTLFPEKTKDLHTYGYPRKKFKRLLYRVDTYWWFHIYQPAFEREMVFFRIQLHENTDLKEDIIDFTDPANTTLCQSYVQWVRGSDDSSRVPKTFIGVARVPSDRVLRFKDYLQECEDKNRLTVHECVRVDQKFNSQSYALYSDKGWHSWTDTDLRRLISRLKTKNPRLKRSPAANGFHLHEYNENWHYLESTDPIQAIKFFCKCYQSNIEGIMPETLPLPFSETEKRIFKELYQHKVVIPTVAFRQLLEDYSMDEYWVILPRLPLNQLKRLLICLPRINCYQTKDNYYLNGYLTSELATVLQELNWEIIESVGHHTSVIPPTMQEFDEKDNRWIIPKILE
ncbi:MAG: hypothetical protein ACXAC8_16245 [Candidatus Hodarchaeales archaeon]|jgi:hypothetical protein